MEIKSFRVISRVSEEGERTVYLAQSDTEMLYHLLILSADPRNYHIELASMNDIEVFGIEVEARLNFAETTDPDPDLLKPIKFIAGEGIRVLYTFGYVKRKFLEMEESFLLKNHGESVSHEDE